MAVSEKRVLVVEDEGEIRQLIALHLKREGFVVTEVADGEAAMTCLQDTVFHLVILDWMLPGRSGLELTRWMRTQPRFDRVPVLFVTAKTDPEHIATGLDAGADDYLAKPFDTIVLMARVHALLRRNQWLNEGPAKAAPVQAAEGAAMRELKAGGLTLLPESFESYLKGDKLDLTRSEFRLLETLLANQGRVLSRESLIEQIQGEGVNVVGRTIDTHVFGLRKKLGDHAELIETIRGVGYRVRFAAHVETGSK
ncbi:MAG: response regulator transcription factor [Bdellovibrionales bacterium]